jgi:DNA mismatch repair protein MLH1
LDAKAKSIVVTVKSGGLKSLSITDNGTGILKENFPLLCERFTTSKLSKYEDLQSIKTYGFRGEALASVSIVSRLTVQTKTRNDICAWKVRYENCELVEGPTACAGNQGTTITFDDIFYNNPIRLKCLSLPSEEFQKIFDVVSKYSVHNHKVSFTLKKFGENNSIKTSSSSSPVDTIRVLYGNSAANSLLDVSCSDDELKFTMNGFISSAEFSGKKRHFLLFINHRLVDCKSLKKAIFDEVYHKILPKNVQPFVYMSLELEPSHVDVNVSPTKSEVNFLNEDEIVEKIRKKIEDRLIGLNDTRKLYTQQLLPGASIVEEKSSDGKEKVYPKDMVRTDAKSQTILKFFQQENEMEKSIEFSQIQNKSSTSLNRSLNTSKQKVSSQLSSIAELREEIIKEQDDNLKTQIETLTYVGVASRTKALIQCGSILYLLDIPKITEELFYQLSLKNFENFDFIELENKLKICDLVMMGFEMDLIEWRESDGEKSMLTEGAVRILVENREMLADYFSIGITKDGELTKLPILIKSYQPLMSYLPIFLVTLATEVDYEDEKSCLREISLQIAKFYSQISISSSQEDLEFLIKTIIAPEIRKNLCPPRKFANDRTFLKLTSLQDLYKVFERC